MNEKFEEIKGKDDVVNIKEKLTLSLIPESVFKVEEIENKMKLKLLDLSQTNWKEENWEEIEETDPDRAKYIREGLEAELLNVGSTTWKKGKVRIKVSIEFCPDEPESILDDFRESNS